MVMGVVPAITLDGESAIGNRILTSVKYFRFGFVHGNGGRHDGDGRAAGHDP